MSLISKVTRYFDFKLDFNLVQDITVLASVHKRIVPLLISKHNVPRIEGDLDAV